jgi:hypothetical protein
MIVGHLCYFIPVVNQGIMLKIKRAKKIGLKEEILSLVKFLFILTQAISFILGAFLMP